MIISSFFCFWKARKLASPFHELEEARPIYMKVDVSKPGVYSCDIEHSQYAEYAKLGADLLLVHDSNLTFAEICKQLEGKVEIFNGSGELVNQFNLHNERHEPQTYRLGTEDIKGYPANWVIYPFTPEYHKLKLTITRPVKSLTNVKQYLEGYYLLNGIEFMVAGLVGLTGFLLLGIGLLIVVIVLFLMYRKRRKSP